MHRDYIDIRSLTPKQPLWFDEYAVPRYVEFSPAQLANIYAREAVLAEIECQACGHPFQVAFSAANHRGPLSEAIVENTLEYGDPPNINCCAAGPTMSSTARKVVQYWANAKVELPDLSPLLVRLENDGAVLERSQEVWAVQMAADLASARKGVAMLMTSVGAEPAPTSWDAGMRWTRHPILEVPIFPDWVLG